MPAGNNVVSANLRRGVNDISDDRWNKPVKVRDNRSFGGVQTPASRHSFTLASIRRRI
jgi:hypothetical protein